MVHCYLTFFIKSVSIKSDMLNMMKVWNSIRCLLIPCWFLISFVSCNKTELSSSSAANTLGDGSYYISGNAVARIYYVKSDLHPGVFVTELDATHGTLSLPKPVWDSTDYGTRKLDTVPQPLDLILRVSRDPLANGDFYFETPVLAPTVTVSNTTTAVSWILRWSFGVDTVYISQKLFSQIVDSIEVVCDNCRAKTVSQVVDLVLADSALKSHIIKGVQTENTGLLITELSYNPPPIIYAWSSPNLIDSGATLKDSKENESVVFDVRMLNPRASSQLLLPIEWHHSFNSATSIIAQDKITYLFDYAEAGSHTFVPRFSGNPTYNDLSFQVNTEDANRNPLCDQPLEVSMRANKVGRFDLSTKCRDLDVDENGLVYVQNTGPTGFLVSSTGQIEYTPPASASGDPYDVQFSFILNDSKQGRSNVSGTIHVGKDLNPVFDDLPASYSFTEGVAGFVNFHAHDPDGDPIKVRVSAVDKISMGAPMGSGDLAQMTCIPSSGIYACSWVFQPSWMQVIGQNGTARVKFTILYDSAVDNTLNGSLELSSQIMTLSFTNTDDPPTFTVNPTDIDVTEGVLYSVGGGNAITVAQAVDSSLNPTAVTFSAVASGQNCDWVTALNFFKGQPDYSVVTDGTPSYDSGATCTVKIIATDANNLSTESADFYMSIADTNRPLSVNPSAPAIVMAKEGEMMNLDLTTLFSDDDSLDDPREIWTYDCKWDDNSDGIYDVECKAGNGPPGAVRINFSQNATIFKAGWGPKPGDGNQDYKVRFGATDKGGSSASYDFIIHVDEAPTPMSLSMSPDLVTTETILTTAENANKIFYISARAATVRPIDQYDYKIDAPTCFKYGGGSCRASLVVNPSDMTGNGDKDFAFKIETTNVYTDGNSPLPEEEAKYIIAFHLQDTIGLNLTADTQIMVVVKNTNQAPTGISFTAKSESCIGTTVPDATNNDFTICVDASKDTKSGSVWAKTYTLDFQGVDPDTTNDTYAFAFPYSGVPGSTSSTRWSFKLPSCVNPGTGTITRTFSLQLSDGRGGTYSRNVILKMLKAQATSLCM